MSLTKKSKTLCNWQSHVLFNVYVLTQGRTQVRDVWHEDETLQYLRVSFNTQLHIFLGL